ncbi:Uu.00g085780.m01.CDS01 [Anthostomella pinea]|uniref:Uu.00g085780.m01.CDS01 n=1 Tax=Anthostomella pinea TaxID=933095 RepID=A0AAI8VMN6_9PEZI|nr:Uu.00g085780.m01.CDS01 [Anthostomella pinea]
MFLSWRHESSGDGSVASQRSIAFDPVTARTVGPQACSNCRAKKVKCNSDPDGCARCRTLGRECKYVVPDGRVHRPVRRLSKQDDRRAADNEQGKTADQSEAPDINESPTSPCSATNDQSYTGSELWYSFPEATDQSEVPANRSSSESNHQIQLSAQHEQDPAVLGVDMLPDSFNPAVWDFMSVPIDTPQDFKNALPPLLTDLDPSIFNNVGRDPRDDSLDESLLSTGTTAPSPLDGIFLPFDSYEGLSSLAMASPASEHRGKNPQTGLASMSPALGESGRPWLSSSAGGGSLCQCLHRLVMLVDETELVVENDIGSLDSALAAHKEALGHCARMIACANCRTKVENMTVLTFFVGQLAKICCYIDEACWKSPPRVDVGSGGDCAGDRPFQLLDTQTSNIAVGMYSADSSDEYMAIFRGLLELQLQRLLELTEHLQRIAGKLGSEIMQRRLTACKDAVTGLLREHEAVDCRA